MAGFTNRGKKNLLALLRGVSIPANFYVALSTSTTAPNADTNLLSDVSQIATGNGYSDGGSSVSLNTTDFDTLTEDDSGDKALTQLKDIVFTASGGTLPASGGGAHYALLLGPHATPSSREVWFFWDLGGDYVVSSGQTLTLVDLELRLTE